MMRFIRKKNNKRCVDSLRSQGLCESMHSIGDVKFINDILDRIEKTTVKTIDDRDISPNTDITVICINFPEKNLDKLKDYNVVSVTNNDLISYRPDEPSVSWIDTIKITGTVIVAPDKKSALSVFLELQAECDFINGSCEVGNYIYNDDNSVSMDLNLYALGYIDNRLIQVNDDVSLSESIYHELMHAYTYYNIHKNTGDPDKVKEDDPEYDKILGYIDMKMNVDDIIADGFYMLCMSIYALSDYEIKAFVGMNYEHFRGMKFKTKEDFVEAVKSSTAGTIIENAEVAINFLKYCKTSNILSKKVSYLKDGKYHFKVFNELLSDVLDTSFLKSASPDLLDRIDVAIDRLSKRLKSFKARVYNVAYDAAYNQKSE